jgi:hypothetical protein
MLLEVPLGDDHPDGSMLVDVRNEGGVERLAASDHIARAPYSLAAALDSALPSLSLVMAKLRAAVADADEICLELGLRVSGEAGVVFVRGGSDATIGVTATWRRPQPEARGSGSGAGGGS